VVFDRHAELTSQEDDAPRTLKHSADAPPPLGHVSDTEPVRSFRSASASRSDRALSHSFRIRLRAWAGRATGRSDRYLTQKVAGATDEIVSHCDAVSDHVAALESLTSEVTGAFGQELAQLRAEVQHLRRIVTSQRGSPESEH
jgi:hypothetical protein